MKFSTIALHTDRQWRAATGLDQKIIDKIPLLIDAIEQRTQTQDRQRPQASEYQQGLYSAKKSPHRQLER